MTFFMILVVLRAVAASAAFLYFCHEAEQYEKRVAARRAASLKAWGVN